MCFCNVTFDTYSTLIIQQVLIKKNSNNDINNLVIYLEHLFIVSASGVWPKYPARDWAPRIRFSSGAVTITFCFSKV